MTVGSLGGIVFTVSDSKIMTMNNVKTSGSASYGKHQRHGGDTLLEFVSNDASSFTFNMTLAAQLGVNVASEIDKLESAKRKGTLLKLVIGKKVIGRYRWVIQKYTASYSAYDRDGYPIIADVSITLSEYLK
ncbi:MAG: phage tail protein [Oscillospiraceae bacterium]|nr:phage tail protein [Oscillospiraceae bacterium]